MAFPRPVSDASRPLFSWWIVLAAGLACGLGGEALLFLRHQCRQIEDVLLKDFNVVVLADESLSAKEVDLLGRRLGMIPGVREARFVSKDEALSRMMRIDPELFRGLSQPSGHSWKESMPASFEMRFSYDRLGNLPQILGGISEFEGVEDIKYKSGELKAVLQVQLYRRFLELVAKAVFSIVSVACALAIWARIRRGGVPAIFKRSGTPVGVGMAASVSGIVLCLVIVYPICLMPALCSWPGWQSQAALVGLGGLTGWLLSLQRRHLNKILAVVLLAGVAPCFSQVGVRETHRASLARDGGGSSAISELTRKKELLSDVRKEIGAKRKEISICKEEEGNLGQDMARLQEKIKAADRRFEKVRQELLKAGSRRDRVEVRLAAARSALARGEVALAKALRHYYLMSMGDSPYFGSRGIWPRLCLESAILHHSRSLKGLGDSSVGLTEKLRRFSATMKNLQAQHSSISATRSRSEALCREKGRSRVLARKKAGEAEIRLRELELSAGRLNDLMERLAKARERKTAAFGGTSSMGKPVSLHSLPWPVEGKVSRRFGKQRIAGLDAVIIRRGIEIEALPGAEVRAVRDGTVIYAGPFRSYGLVAIVDHGGGFLSVYGGMDNLEKVKGQMVGGGEVIGTVGGASAEGNLYLELRRGAKALNPIRWLEKRN